MCGILFYNGDDENVIEYLHNISIRGPDNQDVVRHKKRNFLDLIDYLLMD